MGKRIVHLSAALAGLLYAHALVASEPETCTSDNLLTSVKWLRLEIVGGRLLPQAHRCTQSRVRAQSPEDARVRQLLSVEMRPGYVVLQYSRADDSGLLQFEANERGRISLRRTPGDASATEARPVSFVQTASGRVTLEVSDPAPRTIAAEDLWQLLLAEREACKKHLLPMLAVVAPDWDVLATIDAAERQLVALAGSDVVSEKQRWQKLVDQLADSEFARRQAADHALRACGQPVLAFLRHLELADDRQLDSEQRRRIRAILADLPDGRADSPERVAAWLASDRRVWLALLTRGDLEQRVAAAEHLSKLCNQRVVFDPSAPPPERDAQLAALAALLADH